MPSDAFVWTREIVKWLQNHTSVTAEKIWYGKVDKRDKQRNDKKGGEKAATIFSRHLSDANVKHNILFMQSN